MNNIDFWNCYLKNLKKEIKKLCEHKNKVQIDLHIHSNYSADGKQNIKEILKSTKKAGFDIIAITDHDSIKIYDELYNIVKDGFTEPLIIPGVEFTIDHKKYKNQCHILQLFINPKEKTMIEQINKNYNAMYNRSKIQFERLEKNKAIKEIFKKNKINILYKEYQKYLINNNYIPEYDSLCSYLIEKLKKASVTTFDVLNLLEEYNEKDCYSDRKMYKEKRYKQLREKYKTTKNNCYNTRFLLSMLAVREVDDDWWEKPWCGSLSVNSYGQLKINELNEKYLTFFAHPEEKKLKEVEEIIKNKKSIVGLEYNYRNKYEDISKLNRILKKYQLLKIIGSDSHDNSMEFYQNKEYYQIDSKQMLKIISED